MKASEIFKYILYLSAITGVFFITMLMATIILIGFHIYLFAIGVPIGILITLIVKPYIVQYIYGEQYTVHKELDGFDGFIYNTSIILIIASFPYILITEKNPGYVYVLGESLEFTWLFTRYFIVGAILLHLIRYIKYYFTKAKTKRLEEGAKR